MKKTFIAASMLALALLPACNTKESMTDTNGAVDAKVINDISETEIIVTEDTPIVDMDVPEVADAVAEEEAQADELADEKALITDTKTADAE